MECPNLLLAVDFVSLLELKLTCLLRCGNHLGKQHILTRFSSRLVLITELWHDHDKCSMFQIDIFAFGLVLFELVTRVHAFWQFQSKWDVHSAVDSGFHPSLTVALAKQDSDINDENKESVIEDIDNEDSGIGNETVIVERSEKAKLAWRQGQDQLFSPSLKLPADSPLVHPIDDLSNVKLLKTEKSGYTVSSARPIMDKSEHKALFLDSLKPATVCCPYIQLLFNRCTSVVPGERPSAEDITQYLALYPTHYTKLNCEPLHLSVTKAAQCTLLKSSLGDLSAGNNMVLLYGSRMCYAVTRSESEALTVAQIPLEGPLPAHCTAIAVMADKIWVGWAISDDQHWVTVYDTTELQMIATISVEDSALCFAYLPRQFTEERSLILATLKNGVVITVCLCQKN